MHGDSLSSDTTPLAGPVSQSLDSKFRFLGAVCPTVLVRSDERLWLLCTQMLDRSPVAILLDPESMRPLAKQPLHKGALLGGVYAYLDRRDRMILVDGKQRLLRISAHRSAQGLAQWKLELQVHRELAPIIEKSCGSLACDEVVAISPGRGDSVWWVSRDGLVGLAAGHSFNAAVVKLGQEEQVHNSFSSTLDGEAGIVTDHALYWLHQSLDNEITIKWRRPYDRGPARKPGQLSWGSGSTPSFFTHPRVGPMLTITNNAADQLSVLVFNKKGDRICKHHVFGKEQAGTENSLIAYQDQIFVASTFGYPYPALPKGAGEAVPKEAPFIGGICAIKLNAQGNGCSTLWKNGIASAAVPKLSLATGMIYTVQRGRASKTQLTDAYEFVSIHASSGKVHTRHALGKGPFKNTLQLAGNADRQGHYWQGAMGGVFRVHDK